MRGPYPEKQMSKIGMVEQDSHYENTRMALNTFLERLLEKLPICAGVSVISGRAGTLKVNMCSW